MAIAVDNLATAQELTKEQEEAERQAAEQKEKNAAKEATMIVPNSVMEEKPPAKKTPAAGAAAGAKTTISIPAPPVITTTTVAAAFLSPPGGGGGVLSSQGGFGSVKKDVDVDKMVFTRKVDLDYIPGLDDDLKVILPASFEASLANMPEPEYAPETKEEKRMPTATVAKGAAGGGDEMKQANSEQPEDDGGPKPIVPYSCMFILGPDNWLV